MSHWVVIPVKNLIHAKSRLKPIFPNDVMRRKFTIEMFQHVCNVAYDATLVSQVLVITPDPHIFQLAQQNRCNALLSYESLNQALTNAFHIASEKGAKRVLMLPADIPLVTSAAIDQILTISKEIVIAPDSEEQGTNGLCLSTDLSFELNFGINSFMKHLNQARKKRMPVHVFRNSRLSLDIDTPSDYALYKHINRQN